MLSAGSPSPLQEEKETLQSQAHRHSHWKTGGGKQVLVPSQLVHSLRALDNQTAHLWPQLLVPMCNFVTVPHLHPNEKLREVWVTFSLNCTAVHSITALIRQPRH